MHAKYIKIDEPRRTRLLKILLKSVIPQRLKQILLIYLIILSTLLNQCSTEKNEIEPVIAKVGSNEITVSDFQLFYELDPNFGIDSTGLPALRDELNKCIDQIISGNRAEEAKLFDDPVLSRALAWEKRMAVLRQLYRDVVEDEIEIFEEEIKEEFRQSNIQVHVRHLFTEEFEMAMEWRKRLQVGFTFEQLAGEAFSDTILSQNGGDLGWLNLRDFDQNFARAAIGLKKDEISQPVQTQWGYHIIQLIDKNVQININPTEYQRQKTSLEKKIHQRKGKKLAREFINEYIGKMNPQPDRQTFMLLLNSTVPPGEREKSEYSQKIIFTNSLLDQLKTELSRYDSEELISYIGGKVTLGEYLESMRNVPVSNRPAFKSPRQLSNQIGIWMRDELLYKEAAARNLDTQQRVQKEIHEFVNQQSYFYYLNDIKDKLIIPEAIQEYFLAQDRSKLTTKEVLGRHHTLEEWKFWQAERDLHKELRRKNIDIWIDEEMLRLENDKIDWDGRIRMFMIRKPS